MKQLLLSVSLVFFLANQAFAYQLKGKLTEPNGDPIPYANVYVENTTNGVVTNVKGEYFMDLENGDYTLVFSSLGYKKKSVPVTIYNANKTLDVVLEPEGIELEEIEVTAKKKDKAYEIMKQVIANKKKYIKQFESYTCESYLKASLEIDTLKKKGELPDSLVADKPTIQVSGSRVRPKLNFIESQSTTYYRYPNSYKSVVHGYRDLAEKSGGGATIRISDEGMDVDDRRTEPNNPHLFYLDISDADFNFYRNLVNVPGLGDRPFISPLSETAWQLTYRYKLEETFYENGRVIYKIRIEPKNQDGPFFEGHIFIVDGLFAIKSVNLRIRPDGLAWFKYFQVIHNYELSGEDRWVLTREDYYYNSREGKKRYYGNTIVVHQDYQLDVEHPRNFFHNELRHVEDEAFDRDSSYWSQSRPITLKQAELDFIHIQDSIREYHRSDEFLAKQDSSYNKIKFLDFILMGVGFRDRKRGMEYYFNPLIAQVRPFGVGGYRHALGGHIAKTWNKANKLRVGGEIDYGFKNRDVKGHVRVGYTYLPKKFGKAYVKYGDRYVMVNTYETISAVFSRSNYIRKIYYGLGHRMELVNGLYLDAEVEFADRQAIKDLSLAQWSQDLFGSLNNPVEFEPYREFLLDFEVEYTPGQKYYTEPYRKVVVGSKWPTFELQYKKALPGPWGSELNFDFLQLGITDEFRPGTMGISRWSMYAGRFMQTNNIRFTDFKFFRGSDPVFFANPLKAFQLLGPTLSTTNTFLQAHYLHDFGGTLINKIPLLKRTKLQSTVGAGVLKLADDSFFHSEVYAGLQIPFRLFKTRFKFGTYYVTAYSNNGAALRGQFKIGLTYFNSWTNEWEY